MKISVNWVKEFTDITCSVDELVRKIGAQMGEVDEVIDVGARYQGIVVAKVLSCVQHPNADKLHVCTIDDGGVTQNVERDNDGRVQVVCGAPNVRDGLLVAWLPPGSTVPSTYDKDPFVLGARELRGVMSNGMLASAHELALSDDHNGILELDDGLQPGTSFAEAYGLNDHIIDVENKMFTHRPDCFGQLGVAREIAGIQQQPFQSPEWYGDSQITTEASSDIKGYGVTVDIPDLCPRYMLIAMDGIQVGPSPVWLQSQLARVGVRPINNVVDMTNYIMMLTGQPIHAFDFDKVAKDGVAKIVVRKPHADEQMTLLDGKVITPRSDAILISTETEPIALGGVMGGGNSEIDENTTRILIECANFDMYNIRRTSMAHGLFTDAVTRFNKGQSQWQCPPVLHKAVQMMQELCPKAKAVGQVIDVHEPTKQNQPIHVTAAFINERLGLDLHADEIAAVLKNVECEVTMSNDSLEVKAPFWRTDIEIAEDIVEEVGRLYGYDHLPMVLPLRNLAPPHKDARFELKKRIRAVLSAAGANEVLTYSFVHGNLLDKVGQDKDLAFQLSNALSPDLQYYRLSLTPSLLEKVHPNIKADYVRTDDNEFALFEMNKVHSKSEVEDGLPKEFDRLSLVFAADGKTAARKYVGAPYYQARTYVQKLYMSFGKGLPALVSLSDADLGGHELLQQMAAPYEPLRSALLYDGERYVGIVGEFASPVRRKLKLPAYSAGFEIFLSSLHGAEDQYQPLAKFPRTQQDVSFKVAADVSYKQLFDEVWKGLLTAQTEHGYVPTLGPVDIYQPVDDDTHKNITLRVWLSHPERTLTTEEVNKLLDTIAESATKTLHAQRL